MWIQFLLQGANIVGEGILATMARIINAAKSPIEEKSGIAAKSLIFCLLLVLLMSGKSLGGNCFAGNSAMAVLEPYMIERACHLYAHYLREYRPGQVENPFTKTLSDPELEPDRLFVEFVNMVADKKLISVARGTQLFGCRNDLELFKRDPDEARMKGIVMPEFNCRGTVFRMVPVRFINMDRCYWIAEAIVRCEEQVEFFTTPYSIFEKDFNVMPRIELYE